MSSGRPSARSQVCTAATRSGWVRESGRTQAPSRAPVAGGATGPALNGPREVASPGGDAEAPTDGTGAGAGGRPEVHAATDTRTTRRIVAVLNGHSGGPRTPRPSPSAT